MAFSVPVALPPEQLPVSVWLLSVVQVRVCVPLPLDAPFAPAMIVHLPYGIDGCAHITTHVLPGNWYNRRFRHISAYQSENSPNP